MVVKLTNNFSLEEFTHSDTAIRLGISNGAVGQHHANIRRLAEVMERVRTLLGNTPIFITSGYRSPEVNRVVGGVPDSAHAQGLACDFISPAAGSPQEICRTLLPHLDDLGVDQLINENKGNAKWVHLGLRPEGTEPRHMAFTSTDSGDVPGFA